MQGGLIIAGINHYMSFPTKNSTLIKKVESATTFNWESKALGSFTALT